jgi:hypothetical protein
MNVIAFERKHATGPWSEAELDIVADFINVAGNGLELETGLTENGDAQLYLLGPAPEKACELCVSRIGGRYILEDGTGRLLLEHRSLRLLLLQAKSALRATRWWVVARIVLLWCTIRGVIHDRIEPVLTESEELLVDLTPQLAAFV